ncbi:MAG: hypothetical protein K6U89_02025 [Chloroflexi bacterium]|nr:hypothetical protein [Chloroflexota bacterium]
MTDGAFQRFAREYAALTHDPCDSEIDRFLTRHFSLDLQLAPDIIRSAVRRAINQAQPPRALWEALAAVKRDMDTLSPDDRRPVARPFADPPPARWRRIPA